MSKNSEKIMFYVLLVIVHSFLLISSMDTWGNQAKNHQINGHFHDFLPGPPKYPYYSTVVKISRTYIIYMNSFIFYSYDLKYRKYLSVS